MAWLDDNPPRIQQFRCPRRVRPSGIIGVHTAENFPDETGPDTGAENVANFIRNRTSYGSYHLLCDSDSIIQLVEFRCVAYHIGTHGLNEHTIGISAATQAAKWNTVSKGWRDATVKNLAVCAARAARWLKANYGIDVPARRITLSQALAGQRGFLAHGDADPARRTDPGASFPWSTFLNLYAAEMGGSTPPQEDDLKADERKALMDLHDVLINGNRTLVNSPNSDNKSSVRYGVEQAWHAVSKRMESPVSGNQRTPRQIDSDTLLHTYRNRQETRLENAEIKAELAKVSAQLAGQQNVLQQVLAQSGQPVDLEEVKAAALAGAQEALREIDVRVQIGPADVAADEPDEG